MNITYTGKTEEFSKEQQKKLDARFAKLGKLVERKGEKQAHVVLKSTRHEKKAEIVMNMHDHPLVGIASNGDFFAALMEASDKLEKQIHKLLEKKRESRRDTKVKNGAVMAFAAAASEDEAHSVRVYRVKTGRQKPMTLEEAMIAIGGKKDYQIFRDTDAAEAVSVLIRRKDGHFDLIQA